MRTQSRKFPWWKVLTGKRISSGPNGSLSNDFGSASSAAVDPDPAVRTFERDPVPHAGELRPAAGEEQLDAVGVLHPRVPAERVVAEGVAVRELRGAFDFHRPGQFRAVAPLGDVDVVNAPARHVAQRVVADMEPSPGANARKNCTPVRRCRAAAMMRPSLRTNSRSSAGTKPFSNRDHPTPAIVADAPSLFKSTLCKRVQACHDPPVTILLCTAAVRTAILDQVGSSNEFVACGTGMLFGVVLAPVPPVGPLGRPSCDLTRRRVLLGSHWSMTLGNATPFVHATV